MAIRMSAAWALAEIKRDSTMRASAVKEDLKVMILEPYLFFYGKCEEALTFYKDVFGGEIVSMMRFEGSPMESQIAPEFKKAIMHATFKSPTLEFMASDGNPSRKFDSGNVSL